MWAPPREVEEKSRWQSAAQIGEERNDYYDILEETQNGGTDITRWQVWFLGCLGRSIDGSETLLRGVLAKARFWERVGEPPLNDRQRRVLNKLLDGFEGKLTTTQWAKLTDSSHDTAYRDILELIGRGILGRSAAGGRSTSYALAL